MTTDEIVNNIQKQTPEFQEITKAFIKVLSSKDYATLKRMIFYRKFIGKGKILTNFAYRKELQIMESIDYLYWETKALRELLH